MMYPNDFGDPLKFPLARAASWTIYQHTFYIKRSCSDFIWETYMFHVSLTILEMKNAFITSITFLFSLFLQKLDNNSSWRSKDSLHGNNTQNSSMINTAADNSGSRQCVINEQNIKSFSNRLENLIKMLNKPIRLTLLHTVDDRGEWKYCMKERPLKGT